MGIKIFLEKEKKSENELSATIEPKPDSVY